MKSLLIFASAAMIAVTTGNAFANDGKRKSRGEARFERLDTDKSGALSLEEFVANTTARFSKADLNGDGELSADEMVQRMQRKRLERRAKRMLKRLDFNGDGKVTQDELTDRAQKRFALLDRNNDGKVEKAEMRRSKAHRRGEGKRGRHYRKHRRNQGGDNL
ncbi:MAG: EF-hand domain-containing protein [Pseudomonadota bacterium]